MDTIHILGLRVSTIVGIYEWEREVRQPVVLDLEMRTDTRPAAAVDDLTRTVDYKAVSDRLRDFIRGNEFRLIETMAEQCADIVLREFAVPSLRLRVSKPDAVPEADTVCVEIERQADNA